MATGLAQNPGSKKGLKAHERQLLALDFRKKGYTYDQIAEAVGYRGRAGAYKAVMSALKKTLQEPADEVRKMELERLDVMMKALWPWLEAGSTPHIAQMLKVMERRAKLLGLDAPAPIDVQGKLVIELEWDDNGD